MDDHARWLVHHNKIGIFEEDGEGDVLGGNGDFGCVGYGDLIKRTLLYPSFLVDHDTGWACHRTVCN